MNSYRTKSQWLAVVAVVVAANSCSSHKPTADKAVTYGDGYNRTPAEKRAVLLQGDTSAYSDLYTGYVNDAFPGESLYYSLIMANRYDHPQAYFDVYGTLAYELYPTVEDVDPETANLAIRYLLKAYAKGHPQAVELVDELGIVYDENMNKEQLIRANATD